MPKSAVARWPLVVMRQVVIIPTARSGISDSRSPVRDQAGHRPVHIPPEWIYANHLSPMHQETPVMEKLRRLTKPVSHLVMLGLLALSLHLPAANAALVGTEAVVNAAQAQQRRERLVSTPERDDAKTQLT